MPQLSPDQRAVLRDSAAVGVAVGAYGLSFGAVSVAAGLSVAQTCVLSLLAFTGASQFALVGVLGAGGSAVAGVTTALLLGTRNLLYAVRMAAVISGEQRSRSRLRRLVGAQLVIDESTAMALARPGPALARLAFWSTGIAVYLGWNAATLLGALGARVLGDPRDLGLDAAIPAAFLALLAPRLTTAGPRTVAVLAAIGAALLVPFTPVGVPVLLAAALAVAVGMLTQGNLSPEPA
ncbi:MAG: AzlC family ABC transporter permease [Actinomycetota bacterium]|nr:AzlC family ABC transporter permease [Actinomycetota bacterium]